jgi:hypothetical protein
MRFGQWLQGSKDAPSVPPPIRYNFLDYASQVSRDSLGNVENSSSWKLKPLSQEDMARYSCDDVAKHIERLKDSGHNPTKIGEPLSDEEFKRYIGQTW